MPATSEISFSLYPNTDRANDALTVTTGASVQTAPFLPASNSLTADVTQVLVWCSTDMYCVAGENPTATSANGRPISGGNYVRTTVRRGHRLAFIAVSVTGIAHVSEV